MGQSMHGECTCGYTCNTAIGASRQNFQRYDAFPFLCSECREVVTLNAKEWPSLECNSCGSKNVRPLSDPALSDLTLDSDGLASYRSRVPPFIDYDEFLKDFEELYLEDLSEFEIQEAGLNYSSQEMKEIYDEERRATIAKISAPCWGLHHGKYKCPRCEEILMQFERGILFD